MTQKHWKIKGFSRQSTCHVSLFTQLDRNKVDIKKNLKKKKIAGDKSKSTQMIEEKHYLTLKNKP